MKEIFSVKISKSPNSQKKLVAVFFDKDGKKIKTTHFGFRSKTDPNNDFTKHGDEARKERYLDRHRAREDWTAPMTAGALSRWLLWNKKSLSASMSDYGKRFKIKVISNLK
jgi:hypothetical protein